VTNTEEFPDIDEGALEQVRIAYIKPTAGDEARRMGIVPPGIVLPAGITLYVLHATDGSVLGYTDSWDGAYGAAVQNELTPVAVH
jgi:hypothetical protein